MVEEQLKILDGSLGCGNCGVPLFRSKVVLLTNKFDTFARENQSPLTESKFYNSNLCNNKWLRKGHLKLPLHPKLQINTARIANSPSFKKQIKPKATLERQRGPKIIRMKVIDRGDTQNLVPMPDIPISGFNSSRI